MSQTYIYSRVSTDNQTTDNQLAVLILQYPTALVVTEVVSGAKRKPQLERLVSVLERGDVLVAYSLDRLGRSLKDIIQTLETLQAKGVTVALYREKVTYDTAMGKLLIHMLGAVAELERELISERTKTGLKARQGAGVKLGRPSIVTDDLKAKIAALAGQGLSCDAIAADLGISRATAARWRQRLG